MAKSNKEVDNISSKVRKKAPYMLPTLPGEVRTLSEEMELKAKEEECIKYFEDHVKRHIHKTKNRPVCLAELMYNIIYDDLEAAQKLLNKCPSLAQERCDQLGTTPLLFALYHASWEFVQVLLDHGADIMDKDDAGRTAVHYAVEAMDYLLKLKKLDESGMELSMELEDREQSYLDYLQEQEDIYAQAQSL